MPKSFGIVEEKLFEAEFFYRKISGSSPTPVEGRFYFSAFVSASRSVTLALQTSLEGVDGFSGWYDGARANLRSDKLAPYFIQLRNAMVHEGGNPLNEVPIEFLRDFLTVSFLSGTTPQRFLIASLPESSKPVMLDAVVACKEYFISLLSVVFDCYEHFKNVVDPKWYFTRDNFQSHGKTIGDALVELGFPRNWLDPVGETDSAWKMLRDQQPSCALNDLFINYLHKRFKEPDDGC